MLNVEIRKFNRGETKAQQNVNVLKGKLQAIQSSTMNGSTDETTLLAWKGLYMHSASQQKSKI